MDENLQSKIISGRASEEEKERYFNLIAENKDEEELFLETKKLWVKSGANNPVSDATLQTEFDTFWKQVAARKNSSLKTFRLQVFRYAAVAVLFLAVGGLLSFFIFGNKTQNTGSAPQRFVAERGSLAHVELADGTVVWLNSGSEIQYRQNEKGERMVDLKGEAYFEVRHSNNHPFIVNVGDIKVKDLGTVFNVKAYPDDNNIETTLIEGKVDVLKNNNQQVASLAPGEFAQYLKDRKKLNISKVDVELVSAWKDGKFAFRDRRLAEICSDLENWYDVKFVFKDKKIKDYRYSGVINRSTTIGYVLKMLKITTNIHYQINEKTYGPDVIVID